MHLSVSEITNQSQWELFVIKHAPDSLFQSWLWGEVQKKTNHFVQRFGVYADRTLIGVFQVVIVRARRGSFVHVRHGPIIAKGNTDGWKSALSFLAEYAKKHACLFVRMNPLIVPTAEESALFRSLHLQPAMIHRMDAEDCWVLDITKSEQELLAGMRKTTRYEIRRAPAAGVSVFSTTDSAYFSEFAALYKQTSSRHSFVPHGGIREEFELFARKKQAVLYLAKIDGSTVSAAIILYYGKQAIYHHGASIPSKVPASYLLQWEAILDAKKRGLAIYNFWGIAPDHVPNHPWNGITLFKKGFGGYERVYLHALDMPVSPLYVIPRSIELVRKVLRGYD